MLWEKHGTLRGKDPILEEANLVVFGGITHPGEERRCWSEEISRERQQLLFGEQRHIQAGDDHVPCVFVFVLEVRVDDFQPFRQRPTPLVENRSHLDLTGSDAGRPKVIYDEIVNFIQTGFQMEILGSNETLETLGHLPGDQLLLHVVMDLGGLREEENLP